MFKISKQKIVTIPVDVKMPRDGGGFHKYRFQMEFEIIGKDKSDELMNADETLWYQAVARKMIDVCDDVGVALESNPENLMLLWQDTNSRKAILDAYFNAAYGVDEKAKK